MASELQRLVDSLGDRLGRSVAIDDRNLRRRSGTPRHGPMGTGPRGAGRARRPLLDEDGDTVHELWSTAGGITLRTGWSDLRLRPGARGCFVDERGTVRVTAVGEGRHGTYHARSST